MNNFKRIIINKRKIIIIIIAVLCLIILGTTIAWRSWTSDPTDVSLFITDGAKITYQGGPDISNIVLIPTSSKEKGEADGTGIAKTIIVSTTETLYMDLNLNLETFPAGLKDQSLKWEIYDSNTLVKSGNFGDANQGDKIRLLNGYSIPTTTKTFKLYIWMDINQDNPLTMQNQHFKFVLNAEATDETPSVIASD